MPDYERQLEIYCRRDYKVVKANKMIQLAKNDLSLQELKIFAYCVSMIKPTDSIDTQYEFSIKEYCAIAGINWKSGNNYIDVKKSFTNLLSKTFIAKEEVKLKNIVDFEKLEVYFKEKPMYVTNYYAIDSNGDIHELAK